MSKFCQECGTKNEGVGGQPPKFCSNCGNSFGVVAKASAKEGSTVELETCGLEDLQVEDIFSISGGDSSSSSSFESIIKQDRQGSSRRKGSSSIDSVRSSARNKNIEVGD